MDNVEQAEKLGGEICDILDGHYMGISVLVLAVLLQSSLENICEEGKSNTTEMILLSILSNYSRELLKVLKKRDKESTTIN